MLLCRQRLYNINIVKIRSFLRLLCQETKINDLKNDTRSLESIEEPTTCCMSGCANCVWLDYVDKLNKYFKDGGERALKEIEENITDPNIKSFLLHEIRMRSKK